jgi:hypothetical protein
VEIPQIQILLTAKQLHPVEVHQTDLVQEVHPETVVPDQTLVGEVAVAASLVMVEIHYKDQALAEVLLQMVA